MEGLVGSEEKVEDLVWLVAIVLVVNKPYIAP